MVTYHVNLTGQARNPINSLCPLDTLICVGFGVAKIKFNGETFYDGEADEDENPKTLAEFEKIAQNMPGRWLLILNTPLWSGIWERRNVDEWVCIDAGIGFA